MGTIGSEPFCNCDSNDSRFETSFKAKQNNDMLCPFINTIVYQNYNIDNSRISKKASNKKSKEVVKKKKAKYDLNNYEMNFEYHTNNSNKLKDENKAKIQKKNFFNLNPKTNNDKNSLYNNNNNNNTNNSINNNNSNNTNKNIINKSKDEIINDNENKNEIKNENENEDKEEDEDEQNKKKNQTSIENENENEENNSYKDEDQDSELDKIDTNKNMKSNEINSNNSDNSDNSNDKENFDKPKDAPKNGLDIQVWGKNCYYIGYFKDGMADGIGKLIAGNSKFYGEYKNNRSNGFGIFHNNQNETIYEGYWLDDAQNGCGIEKWNDNSIFIG